MSYRTVEFNNLKDDFEQSATDLLENENPTVDDLELVLDRYNAIIVYAEIDYEKKKRTTKEHITSVIEVSRVTLQRCFEKLNLPVILPGKLLSNIHYVPPTPNPKPKTGTSEHTQTEQNSQNTGTQTLVDNNTVNMPQTTAEFLRVASGLINYKFEGDPLKLATFLADVDLVCLSAENNNRALCLTFVKRCLSGKALECITDDDDTIDKIKATLTANIKPESSDVVEGKMMALRVRKGNFTEFTEEAEKLAEAFRRSLVVSGIPRAKAQEMTIKKTIELCRKTARSDTVKSVISSTKYEQPADVLATLVTQNDIARKEKAESDAIRAKQQSKNSGSQNRNSRFNGRGGGRGNYNNNGGRGGNNYRQQNGQNGNRDQQQRGNGNFRGNGQNRGSQYRNNRNEHTIRFVSGNPMGQMQPPLGFQHQQMPQQQQQDQIYQIPFQ